MAMAASERRTLKHLSDGKPDRIFEDCYSSVDFILLTTNKCPKEVFDQLIFLLDSRGIDWLKPLTTYTSRDIFLGRMEHNGSIWQNLVFKKSRFKQNESSSSSQPRNVSSEIKTNYLLDTVIQELSSSGELLPPQGFDSVSVRVEKPIGMLLDKKIKSTYSIFLFEEDFDLGEILQYTDPPMKGAVNYNPQDWKIFCGIKDVLDRIIQAASREGLTMQDYDIHQALYRVNWDTQSLELVLIDSERFRIENKQ